MNEYLRDLANLRIKIFKDFPYLYEGSFDYEKKYLERYVHAKDSLVVMAFDREKIIGATTCLPLTQESEDFKRPFIQKNFDIDNTFYFGESIILPKYRGQGIGHKFFDYRESHAKHVYKDLRYTCFCAVERINHSLEPKKYRPLDHFWHQRGYKKYEDMSIDYTWKDIGKEVEDKKKMVYWIRSWK